MFYCLYVFTDDLYYVEEGEAVVIYKCDSTQVDIFDIVSKREVNIERILSKITSLKTQKVVFHFTPDNQGIKLQYDINYNDNVLFVKTSNNYIIQSK